LGKRTRLHEASNTGLRSGGQQANIPLSPSTMTDLASFREEDTRAMRASELFSAIMRTHSAPALVLPKPRPARMSQLRQSPIGGS